MNFHTEHHPDVEQYIFQARKLRQEYIAEVLHQFVALPPRTRRQPRRSRAGSTDAQGKGRVSKLLAIFRGVATTESLVERRGNILHTCHEG